MNIGEKVDVPRIFCDLLPKEKCRFQKNTLSSIACQSDLRWIATLTNRKKRRIERKQEFLQEETEVFYTSSGHLQQVYIYAPCQDAADVTAI